MCKRVLHDRRRNDGSEEAMNRDDIIRMAREQGLPETEVEGVFMVNTDDLGRFAAAEREECAKVCDAKVDDEYATGKVDHNEIGWTQACAIAIRERGAP
jgi:hypothetical protein